MSGTPSQRGAAPTPESVAFTKLAPPRMNARIIAREPLLGRLLAARRRRCIVVTGQAGSGKTTLLASWRQQLLPLGFDVAWLTLTPEDDQPSRLLDDLVASLAEVDPAIARDAALLSDDTIEPSPDMAESVVIALVRGMGAHPRELVLVLDDLHHVTQERALEVLQWLIDYAPANLHVALTSRAAVRLSLDRLRSQDQTLDLDLRDLLFSPEETARFLKLELGELDARTVKHLHDCTDGWIAGLQLLSLDWKRKNLGASVADRKPGHTPLPPLSLRDAVAFRRYLEQEVLARLTRGELDMLARVAPCSRFCASLCATLLGQPAAIAEALQALVRLESDNLFVVPIEGTGAETWYRLHPLLREMMLARFSALNEDTQREVHARAWTWFRDRGQLEEAVRHAVQAGESAQAAGLMEACAQSLFMRGERRALNALLQQLPAEQLERSPKLRLWLARTLMFLREPAESMRVLDRLTLELPASDAADRFHIAMVQAALAVQRDDSDSVLALLPRLEQPPPGIDAQSLGGRNNILSWLYMHHGDYEAARRVQLDGAPIIVDGLPLVGTASGSLHGRCLVGMSYLLEGQVTQAERIYRAVAAEAEQGGKACADAYYLAIALLGDVLYEQNDMQQARELLEDKLDVLERISLPDALMRVLRLLSAAHWQLGNRLEAQAYLERLEDYAVEHQLDRLLAHSLYDQVQLRLLAGELVAAETTLARLASIDARHPDSTRNLLGEIRVLTERARVRMAVALGNLDDAASRLPPLIALCERRGQQRAAAHLLAIGAAIDARRGRPDSSRAQLLESLNRGHRLGLVRTLLVADPSMRRLIDELARTEALDPVMSFYAERLLSSRPRGIGHSDAPEAAAGARAPLGDESDALSDRELEILRLLAQAMPNKKIARALGLSPQTVKWYLSRIYGKLSVSGRDEAVARVRDMGLVGA